MRKLFFILVISLGFIISAQADYDVNRLLDSYLVAKADTVKAPITDDEAKKYPFTIQVASYVNEKDAVSHLEELKVQEKEVFYYPAFVRGTVWYKVCVGKFAERSNAEEYRKKFVKRMDEPFSVVISLLDRPSQRQVASIAQKETAPVPQQEKVVEPAIVKEHKEHIVKVVAPVVEPMNKSADMVAMTTNKKDDKTKMVVEEKMTPAADAHAPAHATAPHSSTSATATAMATTTVAAKHAKEPSSSYYSVQVGAFANEKLAQDALVKLSPEGNETFVREADVNGKTWFRAFIGKFENHQAAKDYQQSLSHKTPGVDSFIRKMK
jgi:DedD protein